MHDLPAITREILDGYALHPGGHHGVIHWARVLENGLRIAETVKADREVVTLFALFHDSRRVNEGRDADHGLRGGELARTLRGTLVHLDDSRFELLHEACRLHTDGHTTGNPTLLACWDADRLDLGRVGIKPDRRFLCTGAASDLVGWADRRAVRGHVPDSVLAGWGIHPQDHGGGFRDRGGIERFVRAQASSYDQALAELRAGRKEGHWMWWIFPQVAGLGRSGNSRQYAIGDSSEATAYLNHPILGPRLMECFEALLTVRVRSAYEIFGSTDCLKLKSSATLFAHIAPSGSVFEQVLARYYDREQDELTLALLDEAADGD